MFTQGYKDFGISTAAAAQVFFTQVVRAYQEGPSTYGRYPLIKTDENGTSECESLEIEPPAVAAGGNFSFCTGQRTSVEPVTKVTTSLLETKAREAQLAPERKLPATMKFEEILTTKIDMYRVNLDALEP